MKHSGLPRALLAAALGMFSLGLYQCGGGSDGPGPAECSGWSNQASTQRRAAQDDSGKACVQDADCLIVDYGLDCFADCGYPSAVATSAVPALEASIDEIDHRYCGKFEARGCPGPFIPPCVPPSGTPVARCEAGQCTLVSVPFD
jgi:hypothetical protein